MKRLNLVVIGAGLSGLAAAYRLKSAGHQVRVLEAAAQPGGRCHAMRRGGFLVDLCPEIAAGSYARYLNLARQVGLGPDIVPSSPIVSTLRNGRMIEIDASRPLRAAFTPLLSWRAKLRLLWGVLRHRRLIAQADAYNLADLAGFDDPQTNAEEFSVQAFGREVTDYLIDPLIRIIGGSHANRISRLVVIGGISSWSETMVSVRGGLVRVPEAVAAQLDVHYNARVCRVVEAAAGVQVDHVDAEGRTHSLQADGCVVATQYDDAERLWPRLRELAGDYGRQLRFNRLIDLKLAYAAPTRSKALIGQVPSVEDPDLMLFALSHNKAPDRVPPGHSLFTLYTDDAVYERFAAMSDDALVDWGRGWMEKLYPEVRGHFRFGHVTRQPRTVNFADPGFYRRTAALLDSLRHSPRVQLAGDLFGAGCMEAAVVWGERAADRLVARAGAAADAARPVDPAHEAHQAHEAKDTTEATEATRATPESRESARMVW